MERREALKNTLLIAGYTVSASTIASLWSACSPKKAAWTPQVMSASQATTLAAIADCILPATATPSATSVGVDQFIDGFVAEVFSADARKEFTDGLDSLDKQCADKNGKTFADCSGDQQHDFLSGLDKDSAGLPPHAWGMDVGKTGALTFYRNLKSLIVRGYFTSQEIGKNYLLYNPIPGAYHGCIPVTDKTRVPFEG